MSNAARERAAIGALGSELSPDVIEAVRRLYEVEQRSLASKSPASALDIAYGPHERHRLDVYSVSPSTSRVPVLIWVHGGGFMRGDKGDAKSGRWENANAGRAAAQLGFLGVVMNYRLAPDHPWPAGSEDLASVVDWAKQNASQYGGDPSRIVVAGSSAGAVHVAGYLKLRPQHEMDIRGAILLSGLFGLTVADDMRDRAYYGEDLKLHAARMPIDAVVKTHLPLFVACAEFDPARFQIEFLGLLYQRLEQHGRLPRAYVGSGHNHFSLAFHLGSSDTRLTDEIRSFVDDCCGYDQLRFENSIGLGSH